MKRWLTLLLLGVVSLSILGCNGGGQKEQYLHNDATATKKTNEMANMLKVNGSLIIENTTSTTTLPNIAGDWSINAGEWNYSEQDGWHTRKIPVIGSTYKFRMTNTFFETNYQLIIGDLLEVNSSCIANKVAENLYNGRFELKVASKGVHPAEVKINLEFINLNPELGTGKFTGSMTIAGSATKINFNYEVTLVNGNTQIVGTIDGKVIK